ncbi:hypothetical protein PIROE2DRAFT_10089 [Piromyces sp. E2]|nr:hypothetical protein PIROE2DRAFT_10089 [Piromyces sp. E2]|eukprot:OUM63371.1 hypothetical protein PIROE2DRAFT_10089 [Piromyces sp. E2]
MKKDKNNTLKKVNQFRIIKVPNNVKENIQNDESENFEDKSKDNNKIKFIKNNSIQNQLKKIIMENKLSKKDLMIIVENCFSSNSMNNDFESENSKVNDNKLNSLNKKRSNEIFEKNTKKRRKIIPHNVHEVDLCKNLKDKIEPDSIFEITKSNSPNDEQNISNTSINDDLKNDEMDVYQVKFLNQKSIKQLLIAKLVDIKYQYCCNKTFLYRRITQTPTSRFDDICYLYDINELKQLGLARDLKNVLYNHYKDGGYPNIENFVKLFNN